MCAVHPAEALGGDKLLIEDATEVCPHDVHKLEIAVVLLLVLVGVLDGIHGWLSVYEEPVPRA